MDWTGWTYLNRILSGPGWTGQFTEWAGLDGLLKNFVNVVELLVGHLVEVWVGKSVELWVDQLVELWVDQLVELWVDQLVELWVD